MAALEHGSMGTTQWIMLNSSRYVSASWSDVLQMVKDGVKLDAKEVKNAVDRIRVLEAYLTEVRHTPPTLAINPIF